MPVWVSNGTVGTGTTTVTPGLPASLATGDGSLIKVVVKPDTATINTPSGWTLVANVAGGGGTVGNGTGPQRSATFFREKDASWSTMPAISVTGGTSSAALASRYTKSGHETWDIAAATGVYGTAATTTSANTTLGSNPGITIGDLLEMFVTNQSATPTWSAQSFSSAAATIGAATERSEAIEFATSPQVGGMIATAPVTAGTGSGNPVINATASAATRGTSTLVRLRGIAQPFFPIMDAISPATIKSTTGTTFTTAAFPMIANACIVIGITSDADSNAGAQPTITDNTGGKFTWTRVASIGAGGVGDTGLAALFQGVPTNPGVAPGSMTVTITPNNNGATKPRMIRTSVYDSTQVDIFDPIGAVLTGAFGAGITSISATLTPETTGGGLRMMWLDWNATGVPTTTQDKVGVADFYHNAGLSTNIQLGKISPTVAGVAETIGANFLASTTDGNWLAYELRAPSGVAATTVNPTGLADTSGYGSPTITNPAPAITTSPTGLADPSAFGTSVISTVITVGSTGVVSAGALGNPALASLPPSTTLSPTGLADPTTFGAPAIEVQVTSSPTAIASGEALGSPVVTPRITNSPLGVGSSEAFGLPTLIPRITSVPLAIASVEALGNPSITAPGGASTITPTGLGSEETFGLIGLSSVVGLSLSGIATGQGLGTPTLQALVASTPTAIGSGQAFGNPDLTTQVGIIAQAIASAQAMGNPSLLGLSGVNPGAIVSAEAFGASSLSMVVATSPSPIGSAEQVGSPTLAFFLGVTPTGIITAQAMGNPALSSLVALTPTGLATAQAMGQPILFSGLTLISLPIGSGEAFGTTLISGQVMLSPTGISSGVAFGTVSIGGLLGLGPTAIGSGQALGTPASGVGSVLMGPVGISTLEGLGNPSLLARIALSPSGIASLEAFGMLKAYGPAQLSSPAPIASAQSLGSPSLNVIISTVLSGTQTAEALGFPEVVIDLSSIVDIIFTARLAPRDVQVVLAPASDRVSVGKVEDIARLLARQAEVALAPRNVRVSLAPKIETQEML